jgi:hypothetical protein
MGGWHDARLRSGGSVILSVTGNCRQRRGDGSSILFQGSEALVTIAHFSKIGTQKNGLGAGVTR